MTRGHGDNNGHNNGHNNGQHRQGSGGAAADPAVKAQVELAMRGLGGFGTRKRGTIIGAIAASGGNYVAKLSRPHENAKIHKCSYGVPYVPQSHIHNFSLQNMEFCEYKYKSLITLSYQKNSILLTLSKVCYCKKSGLYCDSKSSNFPPRWSYEDTSTVFSIQN